MALRSLAPRPITCPTSALTTLREFIDGTSTICAITGAGFSTESGIPDYRSPQGSYSKGHKPILHQEFVNHENLRKRYWARSLVGWRHFSKAQPNPGHFALTKLQELDWIKGIVTQNVDRLHFLAGSTNITELHGGNDSVECLNCAARFSRNDYQLEVEQTNADWVEKHLGDLDNIHIRRDLRADADYHIAKADFDSFTVPSCKACDGGIIKPTLVFFGGSVPKETHESAMEKVMSADRLLCMGTSLSTYSAFRLAKAASAAGKPILMLNIGETRADTLPTLRKIEGRCGELLPQILPAKENVGVQLPDFDEQAHAHTAQGQFKIFQENLHETTNK